MKLYVGNLSYRATDQDLFEAFSPFGRLLTAYGVYDRVTGQARGFGFVEFCLNEDAEAAIKALNGTLMLGRALIVVPAKPKEKQPWDN